MVRDYARGIIELEFSRDLGALLPITAEEGNRGSFLHYKIN